MAKHQPKIQMMDINKIFPYEKNAKIHTETQVASLVKVIQTQGWDVPIVVDRNGVVIKGHGRRLAALSMGLKEVPVIVRDDLTDEQVKAARLSDNRVAMGDFDVNLMKDELAELNDGGFDMTSMGFGDKELDMMIGDLDKIDVTVFDEAPSTPEAHQNAPAAIADATPSEDAPKEKALLVTDLLGFKHVPAKYKNALVEFLAKAEEATSKVGAEAFGEFIEALVNGEF
jgi:ParB-like chromosome segregation protein Spo0J